MCPKKQILFVDDEPNFLDGLRRMLRSHRDDWEMVFVESVEAALAATKMMTFDAIVSDVQMPAKTGFDLLHLLRQEEATANIPIIILTGNAETDLKRRALEHGATDLLNKPVNFEDLTARLLSVLRLKSYQDDLRSQNEFLEERVKERTAELAILHRDIFWRLAKAGEYRDEETGNHVIRVAGYCATLAKALGLAPEYIETISLTSPLHDLGKIGVPDAILLKPGKLTPEEWRLMRKHCEMGRDILLARPKGMIGFLGHPKSAAEETAIITSDPIRQMAAEITMSHHEKWDGSGYPHGLKGEKIPLSGRLVAIADVYDALRSGRPYKDPFSLEKALEIMRAGTGSHFDQAVFAAFEEVHGEFEQIRGNYSD